MHMLERGDLIPHFEVTALDGERINYTTLWQRNNLVLVTISADSDSIRNYVSALRATAPQFRGENTVCVITREHRPDIRQPGCVVADKWGEIVHIRAASDANELPSPEELLDWIKYVQMQCPECEGEVR
jgi:peroxiredoxin